MKTSDIQVTPIRPDRWGDDLDVVNAARVSFDKESSYASYNQDTWEYELSEADRKLINYLAKHKHFSPFNHSFLKFRVKAPIFVARQLVKHKFMPWNEVSRRYVDSEPEFYYPEYWRERSESVKQGSGTKEASLLMDEAFHPYELVEAALYTYNQLLKSGVCPEQARMVLPQNTMTEWIWSGTLGAYLDMLKLRLDPHTQYETRQVAEKIASEVERYFPVSYKARMENN